MSPSPPPHLPGATAVAVAALLLVAPVAYAEESGAPVAPGTAVVEPEPAASPAGRPASEGHPRPGRPTGGQVVRPEEAGPAIDTENDGGPGSGSAVKDAEDADTGGGTGGHTPESGTGAAATRPAGQPSGAPATPPAGSARPSPRTSSAASDSAGTSASASPSRVRPGRPAKPPEADGQEETAEEDEALPEPVAPIPDTSSTPRPPAPEAPRERGTAFVTNTSGRPVSVLTLGTGITLIGLGLGFLGLRLRRR
ncbi:hypothetical protein ACIQ7D_07395 [Streptomyces sp. NPDC096310]|uniref:hypothetical protein n=1 Tax=Streptomyces sp. NPDC096310 TaxID=3366082 RepID=UPI00381C0C7A